MKHFRRRRHRMTLYQGCCSTGIQDPSIRHEAMSCCHLIFELLLSLLLLLFHYAALHALKKSGINWAQVLRKTRLYFTMGLD